MVIKKTDLLSRKKDRAGTVFAFDDMKNPKLIVIDKVTSVMPPPNFRPLAQVLSSKSSIASTPVISSSSSSSSSISSSSLPSTSPQLVSIPVSPATSLIAQHLSRTYQFLHLEEEEERDTQYDEKEAEEEDERKHS